MIIYTIYKITNIVNNKNYIGFTKNFERRIKQHKKDYKNNDLLLYRAINKHGWENFKFEILYQSKLHEHTLNVMEPFFINQYDSHKNGYNMTSGGDGIIGYWNEKTKKIQSDFMKSCWTPERKIKQGLLFKERYTGVPKSEETKQKLRGKRPHVSQSGGKNNASVSIQTPFGKFDSIKEAYDLISKLDNNLTYSKIWYKLNTNSFTDWYYINKKIDHCGRNL